MTFPFIQLKSRWLVAAATSSCIIFLKRQQANFFSWSETTYSEKWYYILPSSSRRILWVVRFFWKIVTMHFCQNMVHSKLEHNPHHHFSKSLFKMKLFLFIKNGIRTSVEIKQTKKNTCETWIRVRPSICILILAKKAWGWDRLCYIYVVHT